MQETNPPPNSGNDEAWSEAARRGLTMFCDQMAAAIDGARTLTRLDHLSRSIWQGLAAGAVATTMPRPWPSTCTPVGASYAARSSRWVFHPADPRSSRPGGCKRPQAPGGDCPASPPRRLRSDAACAGLQVHGQRAGGAAHHRRRGPPARHCDRCVDEIAARAGVCRRMVQNASERRPGLDCSPSRSAVAKAAATCRMWSGSSRRSGRAGWPGEGGRAVHPPSR
jgi:hypothetical protein